MLSKLLRKYLGTADLLVSLGGKKCQPCVFWMDASSSCLVRQPCPLGPFLSRSVFEARFHHF